MSFEQPLKVRFVVVTWLRSKPERSMTWRLRQFENMPSMSVSADAVAPLMLRSVSAAQLTNMDAMVVTLSIFQPEMLTERSVEVLMDSL